MFSGSRKDVDLVGRGAGGGACDTQYSTLTGAVSQLLALCLESVQVYGPGPKLSPL